MKDSRLQEISRALSMRKEGVSFFREARELLDALLVERATPRTVAPPAPPLPSAPAWKPGEPLHRGPPPAIPMPPGGTGAARPSSTSSSSPHWPAPTWRDWLAGQALTFTAAVAEPDLAAARAYRYADATIAASKGSSR